MTDFLKIKKFRDHPEGIEGDNLIVYASNDKHLPKIEV